MRSVILSCSGGKDSTAAGLFLKEQGISFEAIFCDTGWEAPETYEYLREVLPRTLGPIRWLRVATPWPDRLPIHPLRASDAPRAEVEAAERAEAARVAAICEDRAQAIERVIGVPNSAMVRVCLRKAVMPSRLLRWCTSDLKVKPITDYLATRDDDPINVVGIRAEESATRARMPEREYDEGIGAEVWRPILRWTLDEVIAIHHRHNLRPNPLYLGSAVRVGCFPCVFSRKDEIRDLPPARVAGIRMLEAAVAELSEMRIRRSGQDVKRLPPTFFQADKALPDGSYHMPIDKVMEWAATGRGGRQYELFAAGREEGCMRWGLCNTGRGTLRIPAPPLDMARPWAYRPRPARLDPYRHLFGVLPDREIARRAEVNAGCVREMRIRSGIPAAPRR